MSEIYYYAVDSVKESECSFCRYITANDTGETGSHQSGFYIPKYANSLLFDTPGKKGANQDRNVLIKWQNSFETRSRFVYYGCGSRNEYRITRFGKNFPFLSDDNIGDLLIISKMSKDYYHAYVLSADEDIDSFFAFFNISPESNNRLIDKTKSHDSLEHVLMDRIRPFLDFPSTQIMAGIAEDAVYDALGLGDIEIKTRPDDMILKWVDTEYSLFRMLEEKIYSSVISAPFKDCQSLIDFSNSILNRRKSRAGKSLEHHLSKIFSVCGVKYESQTITEDNKKPDFIFPGGMEYHDLLFPTEKLVFLGAKTTCKDRWRQVLNEADRIPVKYLFTLQQGVSSNQLREMKHENLILVVPETYKACFAKEFRNDIYSLKDFVRIVKLTQSC